MYDRVNAESADVLFLFHKIIDACYFIKLVLYFSKKKKKKKKIANRIKIWQKDCKSPLI